MNILRLVALAKEGWLHRPRASLFGIRAEELRKMAIGLDAEISGHGAHAQPDQNVYVKLAKLAQESPRVAVLEGWNDVSRMLRQVCDRYAIPCRGGAVEQLNALERRKLLDFHAYALLRDMNSFSVDTMASPSTHIALPVAQDYAVAVRGAQRLLHRLATQAVP